MFLVASCASIPGFSSKKEDQPTAKTEDTSAPAPEDKTPAVNIGSTLTEAMAIARAKAKAREYDFIIDHMLAKECKADMARKYGPDKWKDKCRENLTRLPFYFGWMKKHSVREFGDKIIVTGEHGCHAEYLKVGDSYMIVNFGQHINSM